MNKHSRMPRLLTIGLVLVAGLISWYALGRGDSQAEAAVADDAPTTAVAKTDDSETQQLAAISVPPITLPHFEPDMPPGEGREIFMALCVTCHSPRLVISQPSFPREKWEATVQKMVDVFGAVVPDQHKSTTVDYLVSIRGTENEASQ